MSPVQSVVIVCGCVSNQSCRLTGYVHVCHRDEVRGIRRTGVLRICKLQHVLAASHSIEVCGNRAGLIASQIDAMASRIRQTEEAEAWIEQVHLTINYEP